MINEIPIMRFLNPDHRSDNIPVGVSLPFQAHLGIQLAVLTH